MIRTLNMAMCKPLCGLRGPRECLTSAFGGHAPSGAACLMAESLHLSHPPTPCVHHYGHDVSIPPGRIAAPSLGGQAPMSLSFYFKKTGPFLIRPLEADSFGSTTCQASTMQLKGNLFGSRLSKKRFVENAHSVKQRSALSGKFFAVL